MQVYTIATYYDWALQCGATGPMMIERMFDFLSIARIERVYWRCFEGGLATYPSRIAQRQDGPFLASVTTPATDSEPPGIVGDHGGIRSCHFYKQAMITDDFDPLQYVAETGARRGIEVFAWFTFYEDDHGGHFHNRFLADNPHVQQMDRDGTVAQGAIDFFFPEVQAYKSALFDELLERPIKGVLLDITRHNATPSGDADGIHRFGYNPEIRSAFQQQSGKDPLNLPKDDPQWLGFKRDYQTQFICSLRDKLKPGQQLDLMVPMPFELSRWLCLDLQALTSQGKIDLVMPSSLVYATDEASIVADYESLRKQISGTRTTVAASAPAYWGLLHTEQYERLAAAAEEAGSTRFILYEADKVALRHLTSTRAINLRNPRASRTVKVQRCAGDPADRDWADAVVHDRPCFVIKGADRIESVVRTEFSVLADDAALHVRSFAHGPTKDAIEPFLRGREVFVDLLGARMYWQMSDRMHLFLEPGARRSTFFHFLIDRTGVVMQQTREDRWWKCDWTHQVRQTENSGWAACWKIPFGSLPLDHTPRPGDRWGFNLIRESAVEKEVSSWFVSTATSPDPSEWGDLIFE